MPKLKMQRLPLEDRMHDPLEDWKKNQAKRKGRRDEEETHAKPK